MSETADDDEDLERPRFIRMAAEDTFDGQERVFTRAAYDLQVQATAHSARCGHPGYVPDDYLEHLDGLGIETTITAAELCAIGTWERVGGGYRVLDWEAVEVCLDQVRQDNGEDPRALAWDRDHEASQVIPRDSETFIRLGRHDMPVPGPLADAVLQLITDGRSYRGVGSPQQTAWLFPGHLPGRPITPARLGERLRALGIYAQTGRRAALLDLAAQLPAAVLADLLGLHETTAAKWMHQAGGDWSGYAAELARRPHQT
jgi:hypothetical protein